MLLQIDWFFLAIKRKKRTNISFDAAVRKSEKTHRKKVIAKLFTAFASTCICTYSFQPYVFVFEHSAEKYSEKEFRASIGFVHCTCQHFSSFSASSLGQCVPLALSFSHSSIVHICRVHYSRMNWPFRSVVYESVCTCSIYNKYLKRNWNNMEPKNMSKELMTRVTQVTV